MNIRSIENKILGGGKLTEAEENYLLQKAKDYWEHHPDVLVNFPKWKKNIAWTAGYQHFDYNMKLNKTIPVPSIKKRKIVFNRIKVFVRTLLAKISAEVHHASVVPKTGDSDDAESARLGTRVIEALEDKLKFRQVKLAVKLWLIILNRAYIRVFWNKEDFGVTGYRNKEELDENDEVKLDEEGNPVLTEEIEAITEEGDIGVEAVNPFMCRYDPLYTDRKKWRWFECGEVVDAEALEEEYNIEEGTLKSEPKNTETPWDLEISSSGDVSVVSPEKKEDVMGRTTLLIHFWTPRIWAEITEDEVLDYGINKRKQIPFFRLEERLIPIENTEKGINLNDSMVRDGIAVQKEFIKTKTLVAKAIERASKVKVMLPLNSLISKKQWNTEFGTFLDVNTQLGKPEVLKMDNLPSFTEWYLNTLERDFETGFHTHEASFGRLPERASHASGALVHILLEQDEVVLNPMLQMINDTLSEVWSLILEMVQDEYTVDRLLKHAGKSGQYSVISFRGAQLKGNTDVKVVSQTGLPRGRIARTEYIMKMNERQLISQDQALELLEFGNAERIFEMNLVHKNRARRENLKIEKNPNIDIEEVKTWLYPLEEHLVHLPIHMEDRLSARYENYTENQKKALDLHIKQTYDTFIDMQVKQAKAMNPMPGNPPPQAIAQESGAVEPPPME